MPDYRTTYFLYVKRFCSTGITVVQEKHVTEYSQGRQQLRISLLLSVWMRHWDEQSYLSRRAVLGRYHINCMVSLFCYRSCIPTDAKSNSQSIMAIKTCDMLVLCYFRVTQTTSKCYCMRSASLFDFLTHELVTIHRSAVSVDSTWTKVSLYCVCLIFRREAVAFIVCSILSYGRTWHPTDQFGCQHAGTV